MKRKPDFHFAVLEAHVALGVALASFAVQRSQIGNRQRSVLTARTGGDDAVTHAGVTAACTFAGPE